MERDRVKHPAPDTLPNRGGPAADRFKHLPPAIPIATTVAVVGATPEVAVGPDGADGGGDGD